MNRQAAVMAAVVVALACPIVASAQPVPETPPRSEAQAKADSLRADRLDGQGGCVFINQLQGSHRSTTVR